MKSEKPILICLDRDGTVNKDQNYYLGSSPNWKEQVEILPGVVEGIKIINRLKNSHIFIITNQSGVALDDFPGLDEERLEEVNRFIINKLKSQGANVDGYFSCPYVDDEYVKKAEQKGRKVNPRYIDNNHPDLKPKIGMIEKAAKSINHLLSNCRVFVIGDRLSDVEMGLNAKGSGILVSSFKTREMGDENKVRQMINRGVSAFIAKDFLEAAKFIISNIN